ncbi:MAG: InlB B-repeat-containing protein [Clostridia bacterium]|nr:InlB B-repeat-containing protein [Clostridia bacterium]
MMKKKSAFIALLLAGVMSMGVAASAGCHRKPSDGTEGHTSEQHVYTGEWLVEGDDVPTQTSTGKAVRKCTANDGGTESKTLPVLTDSKYVITENTATAESAGTGLYTITIDRETISFRAATPALGSAIKPENPENPAASVEVKFMNGGTLVETKTVTVGQTVNAPAITSDDGTYFGGWYTNSACTGNSYNFKTPISGEVTFYAKWVTLDAKITYSYAGEETAAFEWKDTNAAGAKVAYKLSSDTQYTEVDKELIRAETGDTVRVDILGLKGNESYDFKITTSAGAEMTVDKMPISAYDRSGYAHFNYTTGVGAYNDDGTLKDNALVIYVTDENKDTVMDAVCTENSDVPMFKIPGSDWGGKNASGIGWWLNNNQYTSSNEGSKKNKVPSNTYDKTNGGKLSFKSVNRPVVIRFIGTVTTPEGCTAYNDTKEGGGVGDNGHMARLKNLKNITLEGVGEDAEIRGWGFHFVAGTDAVDGQGKSFEVRNLTFNEYPEDAIGMEGQQSGSTITAGVERCWIHNNTFLPGRCDNPAESDKAEGDGSCDFKRGQYFTCSYNYFEYCHKTNLVGSSDSSLQYNMTYHHNMWYQCGSRIPLTRQANVHFYNNYVCYDANEKTTPYSHISKPAGSYVHSLRANCYIFSEGNYYEGSKNVTDGKSGGAAKGWNNMYHYNFGTNTIVDAETREQKVSNNCKYGSIDYSSFDTNSSLFYYDAANKRSDCSVTDAATARREVLEKVGAQGFTPRVSVALIDDTNRPEAALSIPEDGLTIDLTKVANNTTVNGVKFINGKNNSGAVKGRGLVATFTVAQRVDISLSSGVAGETACDLLKADGTVIATKLSSYTGTLEAGTYLITTGQRDKDGSLTSLTFKNGVSDAERVQNVIEYINAIGTVEFTEACKEKIEMAQAAYNALSAELKAQVTNSATLTAAANQYNGYAAAPVIEAIAAIGTVNADSGLKITTARNEYNALTAAQKALVTNYATLTAAEAAYEKFEVEGLNNQITALPATSTATTEEELNELLEKYEAVRVMYEDLDEDQKDEVKNDTKGT